MSGQRPPPTDGLVPRRVNPVRPVLGTCARLGSRWARLPHAGLAGECALCVFSLCKSCFIRDIDLCGGVGQPRPAAPQARMCAHDRARRSYAPGTEAAIGRRRSLSWNVGGGTCAHDAIGTRRICTRFFALAASSYHYLTGCCFWPHAGHVFVSNAPVPSGGSDGELK